ncbi:MAG: prepilin-type N-terminal cleavage/methylation domain-containing protein [Myxococcales bacterium]|nr:prepilin-type N-terminal cleavage/methylation domain-containing protein [Myxococcales bacterium]
MKRGKRGERGFTLVELMIALVVSSLLVGMILAIFSRMSIAYREQQQIAGVQQVLAAARATIEIDAKQAGLGMSQGFIYNDGALHHAVSVKNSNAGPDQIAFFYADPGTQAVVQSVTWTSPMTVDSTTGFAVDDIVVISTADLTTSGLGANDGNIAKYSACVLKIAAVGGNTVAFSAAAPWNVSDCSGLPVPGPTTMMYKFVARAYQIDPARPELGALQQSRNGGLLGALDTWDDLAYGFTDIQVALQMYDPGRDNSDSADPDTDGARDWYSDGMQDTLTATGAPFLFSDGLLQASISLVARTDRNVEGIASSTTPTLSDPTNLTNNTIGDRPAVALPSATDPALQGARIYRYTTFQVDFRNLGVGR